VRFAHVDFTAKNRFSGITPFPLLKAHPASPQRSWGKARCDPTIREGEVMNETNPMSPPPSSKEKGGIGYVLLWMMGVPIPLLILFALLRGCA
jgi:hypothetical protein